MKSKKTETICAYIPPGKLKLMQASITDKTSIAYQRISWEVLKKSIHGLINKVNTSNIGVIVRCLLKENIIRGKGLLCRSLIQAQTASPTFTKVYAAVAAVINSKFPSIGELMIQRCLIQFKRSFQNKKKDSCVSSATFIAHFVNQKMAHEIIALEILTLLIENATDESIEVAIAFLKECGQKLTEVSSRGVNAIFDMLRNILHEGNLEKRVQYMIEVMFQIRKDGFKDYPSVLDELDLVEEEDQITHIITLTDKADPQNMLNVFKHDEEYQLNEERYRYLKMEILGNDEEEGSDESDDDEEEEEENEKQDGTVVERMVTDVISFRRVVYLTINSALDFEDCAHKLLRMQVKPGQEKELCHMFLDCCAEQRTYEKFFGLLAQRFCQLNKIYVEPLHEIFRDSYCTIHRLDTNRLRNVAKFFGHLLMTDAISWEVLKIIHLNEEETTSSSRIFIKILFQQLSEYMGMEKLNQRIIDPALQSAFEGLFPRDNPKNTRFSINFFTSIGLGGLTDNLREHLKAQPKESTRAPAKLKIMKLEFSSSSSSLSSLTSSSSSDTSEDERIKKKKRKMNKSKSKKSSKKPKKHSNK